MSNGESDKRITVITYKDENEDSNAECTCRHEL